MGKISWFRGNITNDIKMLMVLFLVTFLNKHSLKEHLISLRWNNTKKTCSNCIECNDINSSQKPKPVHDFQSIIGYLN